MREAVRYGWVALLLVVGTAAPGATAQPIVPDVDLPILRASSSSSGPHPERYSVELYADGRFVEATRGYYVSTRCEAVLQASRAEQFIRPGFLEQFERAREALPVVVRARGRGGSEAQILVNTAGRTERATWPGGLERVDGAGARRAVPGFFDQLIKQLRSLVSNPLAAVEGQSSTIDIVRTRLRCDKRSEISFSVDPRKGHAFNLVVRDDRIARCVASAVGGVTFTRVPEGTPACTPKVWIHGR